YPPLPPHYLRPVLLKTTVGDIDIELWSKECPLACRNFIQLCLEGYYNGTIFHRVVKGFIVQGGDVNGDGTGGESVYGHPFKDEFHSRLRYVRRGLVGMANCGKNDNGSQFFFTLGATPELQNANTLFGKVTGDTIYNIRATSALLQYFPCRWPNGGGCLDFCPECLDWLHSPTTPLSYLGTPDYTQYAVPSD
uniref:Peptidyl-prolyl cis-trans isomerase n=1 Tax=Anopheles atroparvus TaxID=41427 RepID=A0AAG5DJR7_ANOAO